LQHPQHEELLEWVGGHYDPKAFSSEAIELSVPWKNEASGPLFKLKSVRSMPIRSEC
jgi:hypothetical protein